MSKLVSPCTYQGAKQRVASEIVDYIYKIVPYTLYDRNNTKYQFSKLCYDNEILYYLTYVAEIS